MIYLITPAALILGWTAGMWTFRRSLRWCRKCGEALQCLHCLHQAQRLGQTGHHRRLTSSQTP
jgi:hypothetical protein